MRYINLHLHYITLGFPGSTPGAIARDVRKTKTRFGFSF